MNTIFSQNKPAKVKKSVFDLSHEKKLSIGMGKLYPCYLEEIVPGDKFTIDTQFMIRMAPMISPVMHRINAYVHYFYVPNRIIWDKWEDFITGNDDSLLTPTIDIHCEDGSLADYMGLPNGDRLKVSDLPFRAYMKIWNEYYRDENIQDSRDYTNKGQLEITANETPYRRAWEKDYFTSAMPYAQKGNPVEMAAEITYKKEAEGFTIAPEPEPSSGQMQLGPAGSSANRRQILDESGINLGIDNIEQITVTVEELRRATRLQRWLERNARSGSRYIEHLLAHWGVISSDARLQRPEYLGGGKTPLVISEVLNTSGSTHDFPQGNMAGHGLGLGRTNRASKYCEEHGWIIGILSVLPETAYQQGLHKRWTRQTNLDYYFPEFAQLGEQEVLNQELFYQENQVPNKETFGYQSRYAEYKYAQSTVHGAFKGNLSFWHMGRIFGTLPGLNKTFIEADPTTRIFADSEITEDEAMYVQLYNKVTAVRPMPFFNDPTL